MRPFSEDLRLRIHEARQAGETTSEVAERFGVSTAFVRRLEQRFRLTGCLAPRPTIPFAWQASAWCAPACAPAGSKAA